MLSSWRSSRKRGSCLARTGLARQAIVADAVKACGQHVNEEAPDELVGGQGHGLVAITPLGTIVLPFESDTAFDRKRATGCC